MSFFQLTPGVSPDSQAAQDAYVLWACDQFHDPEAPRPFPRLRRYHFLEERPPREQHPRDLLSKEQIEHLEDLYLQGFKVYHVLHCSYLEFENALLLGTHVYPGYQSSQERYHAVRMDSHGYYFRKGCKYVRNLNHLPKEIDEVEQARRDWRKKKGFTRDYRRSTRSFRGRRKSVCKAIANREHRSWEKQCLAHERYDELTNHKNKAIFDPWKID